MEQPSTNRLKNGLTLSQGTGRIRHSSSQSNSRPYVWDVMQGIGGANARTQLSADTTNNSYLRNLSNFEIEVENEQQTLLPLFEAFKKALEAQRQAINEPSVNQNSLATDGKMEGYFEYIRQNVEANLRSIGLVGLAESFKNFFEKESTSPIFITEMNRMYSLILEKKWLPEEAQDYFLGRFIIQNLGEIKKIAILLVKYGQEEQLPVINRFLFEHITQKVTFQFIRELHIFANKRAFDMQFSANEKDVDTLFKATLYKLQSERAAAITDGKQIAKKADEFIKKYIASKEASIRADINALNDTNLIEILNDIQNVLESIQLQDFLEYMGVDVNLH